MCTRLHRVRLEGLSDGVGLKELHDNILRRLFMVHDANEIAHKLV